MDVLIVEDDSRVRGVMTAVLSAAGYRVREAESGERALAIAADPYPDIVVDLEGLSHRELSETPEIGSAREGATESLQPSAAR